MDKTSDSKSGASTRRGRLWSLACLIIRLVIQTIRRDRSGSVWIDGASNVSRPDPSGADQIDVEHQATDLAVRSDCPLSAPTVGATTLRLACALARLILGDLEQESGASR